MLAINIISTLRKVPSLQNVPENMLMALIAIAAVLGVFFLFIVFFILTDFVRVEQKEHHAPDSHKLIMDLQKTLIDEMKGTSKQNKLMINLTILFIAISLVGIIASIVGGPAMIDFCKRSISSIMNTTKTIKLPVVK